MATAMKAVLETAYGTREGRMVTVTAYFAIGKRRYLAVVTRINSADSWTEALRYAKVYHCGGGRKQASTWGSATRNAGVEVLASVVEVVS